MHVDAEVVARAVHHVAPVLSTRLGRECLVGGHRQQAPLGDAGRDHGHRGLVHLAESGAWAGRAQPRIRRLAHRLVDPTLHLGEAARNGQGARDVGGVEAVDLDAGVDQHEIAGNDGTVVAGPVQVARVGSGRRDRVVAFPVPVRARAEVEDALDNALAAGVRDDAGERADDVVEPVRRDLDGEAHLLDLEFVLDEPQLGHEARQVFVLTDHEIVVGCLERLDVCRSERQIGGDTRESRARADPELTDRGVGVELGRIAVGSLAEVQGLGVSVLDGVEHEDGVGLGIPLPPRQVRES